MPGGDGSIPTPPKSRECGPLTRRGFVRGDRTRRTFSSSSTCPSQLHRRFRCRPPSPCGPTCEAGRAVTRSGVSGEGTGLCQATIRSPGIARVSSWRGAPACGRGHRTSAPPRLRLTAVRQGSEARTRRTRRATGPTAERTPSTGAQPSSISRGDPTGPHGPSTGRIQRSITLTTPTTSVCVGIPSRTQPRARVKTSPAPNSWRLWEHCPGAPGQSGPWGHNTATHHWFGSGWQNASRTRTENPGALRTGYFVRFPRRTMGNQFRRG